MATENKCILVTGGAGYIGSHTVVSLISRGFTPIIIDDFRNAHKDVIDRLSEITQEQIFYFNAACQDKKRLKGIISQFPVEGVIHFAADKAVGESVSDPLKYFNNNLSSLVSILELIQEFRIKQFVFSSSCTVYGSPEHIPVTEENPTSYNSPYGYTKLVSEEIITQFIASEPDLQATILRYFNPIGAHESGMIGEEPDGIPNNLLPFITQTALGLREKLTVFGDDYDTIDGTCVRDYIHVEDLAEAHVVALENINKIESNPAIYNIGTGRGTSVLEMIQCFNEVSGKELPYVLGPRRAGDVPEIFADVEKATKGLSWKAKRTIKEAVSSAWKFEQYIREKRKNS